MSQGDIVKIIPAGFQNFEMRVGGDFVFIKECARDVVVTIEDKTTKMIRGDKRRVERKEPSTQAFASFQVSNNYDFDLRVVFVVGEGDFNSQIVTGELSVSETIKTTSLNTNSLPLEVHKKYGFVSAEQLIVNKNDLLSENKDHLGIGGEYGNEVRSCMIFGNYIYVVDAARVSRFDMNANLIDEVYCNYSAINCPNNNQNMGLVNLSS